MAKGFLKTFWPHFLQTQFLSSGSTGVGQWVVPITLCCCSYSHQEKFLFHGKQEDFDLSGLMECQKKDNFWIKLNVNQTSFYRVSYDEELASRLRYAIETNKLSAADRYGKFSQYLHSSVFVLPYPTFVTLLLFNRCTWWYLCPLYGWQTKVSLLAAFDCCIQGWDWVYCACTSNHGNVLSTWKVLRCVLGIFFPLSNLNYFALQTSLNIAEMMAVAAPEELGNLKKFLIDFLEPFAQ